jgi:adenosylmethionine-8-amino-7-oxononanoate aminotransferase
MPGESLSSRDARVSWHPYAQAALDGEAIGIVRGRGAILFDATGGDFIDATSSWWVNLHGHAHPAIAERIARQAKDLAHVMFAGMTHWPAVELAERLLGVFPGHCSRVFYTDDGSTAVEAALKMAVQSRHNRGLQIGAVLTLTGGYHGDTVGAMSLAGKGTFNQPFGPLMFQVLPLPRPDGTGQSLGALEGILRAGPAAAIVYEPMLQAAAGMHIYDPGEMNGVLQRVRAAGALLIADEVMTGFGRTGPLFASSLLGPTPDIACLSKGITGGTLPLGAVLTTEAVFEGFAGAERSRGFLHGHSYTANPVACAAALASLDLLLTDECAANRARIEGRHRTFVAGIQRHPRVESGRMLGTMAAITLRDADRPGYFSLLRDRLYRYYVERRVLLRPLGNIVYVLPPYCITDEQLERVYAVIRDSLEEVV